MKKSIKYFIFSMVSGVMFLPSALAATITVSNGSAPTNSSGVLDVSISDSDLSDYTKMSFEFSLSGTTDADFDFIYEPGSTQKYSKNGDLFTIEEEGGLSPKKIGTIRFTTSVDWNTDFTITPVNVKIYKNNADTGEEEAFFNTKVVAGTVKYEAPKSTDATLTSLSVSQGTISPAFDAAVFEYKVIVSDRINTLRLNANGASGSKVTGTGSKTLVIGKNEFDIEVVAEDGINKNTYKVIIFRGEEIIPSAYLKSLTINNVGSTLSPEFDKKNNKYTVEVPNTVTELDLKYELEEETAVITINGNENFEVGENKVTINIKASDESDEQTYELLVTRKEPEPVVEEPTDETTTTEPKPTVRKKKWYLLIPIGIVIALIVAIIAVLLFRKGKKSDKLPKKEEEIEDEVQKPVELFDLEKTQTFDHQNFREDNVSENLEKTKEYDINDFR